MTHRLTTTARMFAAAALLVVAMMPACSQGPEGGTETHWQTDPNYLQSCTADAECGELSCIRMVCTRACDAQMTCGDADGAICFDDASAPICTQSCEADSECAQFNPALTCQAGFCLIPSPVNNNMTPNNTSPNNTSPANNTTPGNNTTPNNTTPANNTTPTNNTTPDNSAMFTHITSSQEMGVMRGNSDTMCEFVTGAPARCLGPADDAMRWTPPVQVLASTIEMGDSMACGLIDTSTAGNLRCWGDGVEPLPADAASAVWVELSVEGDIVCARSNEFRVSCWQGASSFKPLGPADIQAIELTGGIVCGAPVADERATCAQMDGRVIITPSTRFVSFERTSGDIFCGVDQADKISCFAGEKPAEVDLFIDTLAASPGEVAVFGQAVCVSLETKTSCQGDSLIEAHIPGLPLEQVVLTSLFACGLDSNDQISCWGDVSAFADTP